MHQASVIRSLYEFLAAYIHAVSYICDVYPPNTYKLVSVYDTTTYQNTHKGVNLWVENACKSLMQLIGDTPNTTISIVVLENKLPIERFAVQLETYSKKTTQSQLEIHPQEVNEQLRSLFVRLYTLKREVRQGNREMSLFLEGDLDEANQAWLRVKSKKSEGRITPIRSVELGEVVLNTFRQYIINTRTTEPHERSECGEFL